MKKGLKIISIVLGIVIILGLIFFTIDYNRVKNNEKPIFCIPSLAGVYLDGGTIEYFGLGYKVIDFNRLGGYDEIKIGTWFMEYNDFEDEYEKEPGIIPTEQLEITGFDIESAIIIDGEDYETILGILKSLTYNQELCSGINKYTIKLNDGKGTTYFIKSDCNGVSINGKQAEISNDKLQKIESIILNNPSVNINRNDEEINNNINVVIQPQ